MSIRVPLPGTNGKTCEFPIGEEKVGVPQASGGKDNIWAKTTHRRGAT